MSRSLKSGAGMSANMLLVSRLAAAPLIALAIADSMAALSTLKARAIMFWSMLNSEPMSKEDSASSLSDSKVLPVKMSTSGSAICASTTGEVAA